MSEPVRWGNRFASFELTSCRPEPLERARDCLAAWRQGPLGRRAGSWTVHPDGEGWSVECPDRHIPCASLDLAVANVEFLAIHELLTNPEAPLSLHCALLELEGQGLLLVGPKECGKSTLSTYLWSRGAGLLSDDGALIEPESLTAYPVPRRASLRPSSRELLGEELFASISASRAFSRLPERHLFHPADLRPGPDRVRISAIFLMDAGDQRPTPEAVPPVEALFAVFPHTNLSRRENRGPGMAAVARLVDQVPVYRLGRGPLEVMHRNVEEVLQCL